MADLKQFIYDHLSQDSSIMVFSKDSSLDSFDTDPSTEVIEKNKIKIKIKVNKDKDNKNIVFEYQECNITLISKDIPLEPQVHGEALKRSLRQMEYWQPLFDASLAGDTWIDVVDYPIWDGSVFIDVSMWIPQNTIRKIYLKSDPSSGYDLINEKYILDLQFYIFGNVEKIKK